MTYRAKFRPLPGLMTGLAAAGVAFATGCTGTVENPGGTTMSGQPGTGNSTSTGGSGNPGAGNGNVGTAGSGNGVSNGGSGASVGGAGSTTGGTVGVGGAGSTTGGTPGTTTGGTGPTACTGDPVVNNKRIVRLSFNQISNSVRALFGDTFGAKVDADFEIGTQAAIARTFPPLAGAREGAGITKSNWPINDQIAAAAGTYTLANLNAVTACGAAPTDACAQMFVRTFAEKAYRRPLTAAESTSIMQVYNDVKAIYTTIPEALQHAVYAIMQAPQVLYRTEFGAAQNQDGALTPYEFASALSYFLTDGPPDAALLQAARDNRVGTVADIGPQVTRILATPAAKKNLEGAMFSYFSLDNLATVAIDDPAYTRGTMERPFTGVRESAYHELELFLANTLWAGPLTALLTSKKSSINTTLAPLYGVTLPAQPNETTFVSVDLPANRSGLLTQVGFLASNSRPDVPSVVARGLVVNAALLCATNPPFPEDPALVAAIEAAGHTLINATEREKANYRVTTAPCSGCHQNFDAYGLALENYDIIGRWRTMDPEGRPIDASVTLPAAVGGAMAKDAVEMLTQLSTNPAFPACVAKNMLAWSLAEGTQLTPTSCATQAVATAFNAGDKTFGGLLREVAISQAFTNRKAGVAQ